MLALIVPRGFMSACLRPSAYAAVSSVNGPEVGMTDCILSFFIGVAFLPTQGRLSTLVRISYDYVVERYRPTYGNVGRELRGVPSDPIPSCRCGVSCGRQYNNWRRIKRVLIRDASGRATIYRNLSCHAVVTCALMEMVG